MGRLQSSLTFSQAKIRVAESAGASTASELTRAGYAVCDALRDWNNYEAWQFLGKSDATLTITSGTATLPDDFKYVETVTLSDGTPLSPINQQYQDINVFGSSSTGSPSYYNLFLSGYDNKKITIVPAPSDGSTIVLKYQRALTIPTNDADILQIPVDYEGYMIAQAKFLYLLDKDPTKAAGWERVYREGLRRAIAAETRRPKDNKILMPEGGLGLNYSAINIPDVAYPAGG